MIGYSESERTATVVVLCRLLRDWRDDPDKLAVAVAAYRMGGWHMEAYEVSGGGLRHDDACVLVEHAMYRRNRRKLKHEAAGLLLGVQALARDAEAHRLHGVQVESAVIDCRELPIEDRIAKLRAMESA